MRQDGPVSDSGTTRRQQLIGSLVIGALIVAALIVAALVWISRSGDRPAGPDGGNSATASMNVTAETVTAPPTGTTPTVQRNPAVTTNLAAGDVDPISGLRWIDESQLPAEGRQTLELIRTGGPYLFPRNDDQRYNNNNGALPKEQRGYYREYTVITPGSSNRGARRIIAGDGGDTYYTADHYESFRKIRENT